MSWIDRLRKESEARGRVQAEPVAFVHAAYQGLLDREPEPEGLATWCRFLREGGSVDEMIERIGRSEEFRRRAELRPVLTPPSLSVAAKIEELNRRPESQRRLVILGNCQARQMAAAVQSITSLPRPFALYAGPELWPELSTGALDLAPLFEAHQSVWVMSELWARIAPLYEAYRDKVMLYPPIRFAGFHPDLMYVVNHDPPGVVHGPADGYHSSIGVMAWKAGLPPAQACELFRDDVFFGELAFDQWWWLSWASVVEAGKQCDIQMAPLLDRWARSGCFMHTTNHPKLHVMADVARVLLERMPDVPLRPGHPERFAYDYFTAGPIWPVYPSIARRLKMGEGSYEFVLGDRHFTSDAPVQVLGLEAFLEGSFAGLDRYATEHTPFDYLAWPRYKAFLESLQAR